MPIECAVLRTFSAESILMPLFIFSRILGDADSKPQAQTLKPALYSFLSNVLSKSASSLFCVRKYILIFCLIILVANSSKYWGGREESAKEKVLALYVLIQYLISSIKSSTLLLYPQG